MKRRTIPIGAKMQRRKGEPSGVRGMCDPPAQWFGHPAYTQPMPNVTIAVAAHPLAPGRHLVVAWLAGADAKGSPHTRGLAEIWVGPMREGLARIATQALDE